MDKIYLAHGGREVVVGGKVTFTEGASVNGGIIDYVSDSTATTVAALRNDFNNLLAALRASGLMKAAPIDEPVEAPDEQDDAE